MVRHRPIILVCILLLLILIPVVIFLFSIPSVTLINESKFFHIQYKESKLFRSYLKKWLAEQKKHNKKSVIKKITVVLTDNEQEQFKLINPKDPSMKLNSSSDFLDKDGTYTIRVQLNKNLPNVESSNSINFRFFYTVVSMFYVRVYPTNAPTLLPDGLKKVIRDFSEHPKEQPFTVRLLK